MRARFADATVEYLAPGELPPDEVAVPFESPAAREGHGDPAGRRMFTSSFLQQEKFFMNARHKLNRAHLLGAVCIAAFFGAATQSWAIFLLVGAALVGGLIYSGNIRFDQRRRW